MIQISTFAVKDDSVIIEKIDSTFINDSKLLDTINQNIKRNKDLHDDIRATEQLEIYKYATIVSALSVLITVIISITTTLINIKASNRNFDKQIQIQISNLEKQLKAQKETTIEKEWIEIVRKKFSTILFYTQKLETNLISTKMTQSDIIITDKEINKLSNQLNENTGNFINVISENLIELEIYLDSINSSDQKFFLENVKELVRNIIMDALNDKENDRKDLKKKAIESFHTMLKNIRNN